MTASVHQDETNLPRDPMSSDSIAPRPRWSVEAFERFWARPDARLLPAAILTPDVAGYWPGNGQAVRGPAAYIGRLAELIEFVPGIRIEEQDSTQAIHGLGPSVTRAGVSPADERDHERRDYSSSSCSNSQSIATRHLSTYLSCSVSMP